MINRKILEAITTHPSLKDKSLRTIYSRIDETRKQIGTWHSRRAAAAYFASKTLGIDVYRILQEYPDQLEELNKISTQLNTNPVTKTVIRKVSSNPQITVDEKVIQTYLLPRDLAVQAVKMAKTYPFFYVFENLLRHVVIYIFREKYGEAWWNKITVGKEIREQIRHRKEAEGKDRWVGKRGKEDIFYTDLGDLGLIINSNIKDFQNLFPSLTWIKSRIDDLEKSRNILAHNNVLPDNEIKRIQLYLEDLQNQLAGKIDH